jgi:hypothetical protein
VSVSESVVTDSAPVPAPPSGPRPWTLAAVLERAARRLAERLAQLEEQLQQGDAAAWPAFCEASQALAAVLPVIAPGARGELLTTQQMAERLGIAPKTLLRRRARGQVKAPVQLGERGRAALRWRGDEVSR